MPVTTRRSSPRRRRGLIHGTSLGVGRHGSVDQHALERMIEVPVIDRVLVVPDGLARRGPQRERRVVIEVLLVVAGQHELRRRRRDRGADVDEVELGVVARNHPRADVPALFVRHVAPAVAAGLAGFRDRALAPELLARARVVARDDASVGAAVRLAVASRDQHAVGDERRRALLHVMDLVVEDLGFPDLLAASLRRARRCKSSAPLSMMSRP